MKFKDSPNWGQRKKFYGKEAIDLISTIISMEDEQINFIGIHYGAGDSKQCENSREALDFLAEMDLEDVWMITAFYTDYSCCTILIYKDEFMEDYAIFEAGEYSEFDADGNEIRN